MAYSVIISASAEADLLAIYTYIEERAGAAIAIRFVDRIEQYCLGFADVPKRGTRRDDLRRGLRTVGFRRRATILFEVDDQVRQVVIHGIYYAGRSIGERTDDDFAD
jgi:plasmid stabilization system protein ParE